ncbi:hypothetical protein GF325_04800 [Candidatus Bathyarchaeota archaeon]|nr:hypothetical protein [Candidatus Bathyarchaeota archaeon]
MNARHSTIIWLVTGEVASASVKKIVHLDDRTRMIIAPVSVASFLSRRDIVQLVEANPSIQEGIIIIPGSIKWNEDSLRSGLKVLKGPRQLHDLPGYLKMLKDLISNQDAFSFDEIKEMMEKRGSRERDLPLRYPEIINERIRLYSMIQDGSKVLPSLQNVENQDIVENLSKPFRNFTVEQKNNTIHIGRDFPPAIMAEIINAPERDLVEIREESARFLEAGADIIDIGCTPGVSKPDSIAEIINYVKDEHSCLVSIDSLDEREIISGVDAGASVILSIDEGNSDILPSLDTDLVLVLIPTNMKVGKLPAHPLERVKKLEGLVGKAIDAGFTKLLADPILNSPIVPGTMLSIEAYSAFHRLTKEGTIPPIPMFVGGSNVTEMIDADSHGINALLAVMGIEIGVGILFTTEDSHKCLGSVSEMATAAKLTFMAKMKGSCPKNLGFDALRCKSKHPTIPLFDKKAVLPLIVKKPANVSKGHYTADPSGIYFKIMIDARKSTIQVAAYNKSKPIAYFEGISAEILGKIILDRFPSLTKEHLLYLGRELARAEDALEHHGAFVQDALSL